METYNYTLAKTMDFINERVIKYFSRETEIKPTYHSLNDEVHKKYKGDSKTFEYAIRIMIDEGYIEDVHLPESTVSKKFRHTSKGLLLYLNGGFTKQLKRESAKNKLYLWGQISLVIAAIYYSLEVLKFFKCLFF